MKNLSLSLSLSPRFGSLKNKGFTLVELMIVIGIIGILSAVLYPILSGYLYRSKVAIVNYDLKRTSRIIATAYAIEGKSLGQITGNYCSLCMCRSSNPGFYTGRLDTSTVGNACYDNLTNAWQKIQNITGSSIKVPFRDPWGGIYMLDENYMEPGLPPCVQDYFGSAGPDSINNTGDDIGLSLDFPVPCP